MRYLLLFLKRNYFYLLFVVLEVVAVYLTISNHHFHYSVMLNATGQITGGIENSMNNLTEYLRLKDANIRLAEENARLRAQLKESMLVKDTLHFTVTDTLNKQQYAYIPAKVISNSVTRRSNYIMLNKGLVDGIRPDMAVISPDGIVGIVSKVSRNFAWVNSVLHKQTKISAKIKKNGFVGTITWDGKDHQVGSLKDIPANVQLKKGDTVITSGYSFLFPTGIMVGKIKDFKVDEGYHFYDINLEFSQEYNKLAYVYVVVNLMKEEQVQLQEIKSNEQ